MTMTTNLALLALEYERIGQRAGERWLYPYYDMPTTDYLALLRLVPDQAGLRGYLAARATFQAERLVRPLTDH